MTGSRTARKFIKFLNPSLMVSADHLLLCKCSSGPALVTEKNLLFFFIIRELDWNLIPFIQWRRLLHLASGSPSSLLVGEGGESSVPTVNKFRRGEGGFSVVHRDAAAGSGGDKKKGIQPSMAYFIPP